MSFDRPRPLARVAPNRVALALTLAAALAACGDGPPPAQPAAEAMREATLTAGDITVRANVLRTSSLNPQVAQSYGIARDGDRVLLLVAVRRGPDGADRSTPAKVTATVSRLTGAPETLSLREQSVGELVDHVATLDIHPPETLSFDIAVAPEGAAPMQLRFVREFTPE